MGYGRSSINHRPLAISRQPSAMSSVRLPAAGQTERADPARIGIGALLQIIADVPNCAVVARVDGGLRVVLPPQRVLRALAFGEYRLAERQQARWIVRQSPREALPGKVRRAAERVADPDVPVAIDRGTRHPAEEPIRRVGP